MSCEACVQHVTCAMAGISLVLDVQEAPGLATEHLRKQEPRKASQPGVLHRGAQRR